MDSIDAARAYYLEGWSVIPLRYASKVPNLPRDHGLLGRRATPEELRGFSWEGVGVVTGSLSGIVVLDIDGERGMRSMNEGGYDVPITVTAKTPNGWHHYFQYTDKIDRSYIGSIAEGVDIKSNGGYVVAPPSVHPSGEVYRWADELGPKEVPIASPPSWMVERASTEGKYSVPFNVGGEVWGQGQRNTKMVSLCGTLFARGFVLPVVASVAHEVNKRHCSPPMQDAEVEGIVNSVGRYYG